MERRSFRRKFRLHETTTLRPNAGLGLMIFIEGYDTAESVAQEMIYEWLENEMWDYLSDEELESVDDEDMPVVQQVFAQIKGWA
jgi:hypothetical protein